MSSSAAKDTASSEQPSHENAAGRSRAVADMVRNEDTLVQVRGNCMAPLLEDGWTVRVAPGRVWIGDVVALVARGGGLTLHRYLGQRPFRQKGVGRVWLAVTRPDQGASFDPEVPRADVLGVATHFRRSDADQFEPLRVGIGARLHSVGWLLRYVLSRLRSALKRMVSARGPGAQA